MAAVWARVANVTVTVRVGMSVNTNVHIVDSSETSVIDAVCRWPLADKRTEILVIDDGLDARYCQIPCVNFWRLHVRHIAMSIGSSDE